MGNLFAEIEDKIFFDDALAFDETKIKESVLSFITDKINSKPERERPFFFEEAIYNFFDYIGLDLIKTKKTRDFGIDGVVKFKLNLLGDMDLGLQIKSKLVGSHDVDAFISVLRNVEL
ncbi:MAG: restriction endonuclease [archaeon]